MNLVDCLIAILFQYYSYIMLIQYYLCVNVTTRMYNKVNKRRVVNFNCRVLTLLFKSYQVEGVFNQYLIFNCLAFSGSILLNVSPEELALLEVTFFCHTFMNCPPITE